MIRKFIRLCLIGTLLLTGCSRKEMTNWIKDGHLYSPPDDATDTIFDPLPADVQDDNGRLFLEKPIVRVISGNEVSGLDEARALLSNRQVNDVLGLRTRVDQLALQEVPLFQVAATLSELSGYNIAVSRAASGIPVTLYMQNIPLRQALEAICRLNDLWYREDERIVTLMTVDEYSREMVVRRNEKSRAYWLRYTNANDMAKILQAVMSSKVQFNDIGGEEVYGHVKEEKQAGQQLTLEEVVGVETNRRASRGGRTGGARGDSGIQGFDIDEIKKLLSRGQLAQGSASALEMSRQIEKEVPTVITVFKRNNAILARSLDETILEDIGRIIELMDTPTSQVLLEMSILQINLEDGFESFFQIDFPGNKKFTTNAAGQTRTYTNLSGSTMPASTSENSPTLNLLFGNHNIQARMQLYAREDRLKVVSTPFLMSANNARVKFFVGQEVPLRDDVESRVLYDNDGNVTTTTFEVTVKREELGTDIDISSFINEDGTITMDMVGEISSPQYNVTTIGVVNDVTGQVVPFPLDGIERSKLTSIITAGSGQTIAIGGIIREGLGAYENRVPGLGRIPVLGFFFKDVQDSKKKIETVILLTPHIIRHPELAGVTSREFLERRSSHPVISEKRSRIADFPVAADHLEEDEGKGDPRENGGGAADEN